ncbi:MAG: MFS transporter [Proteobacteria bacterium]|nr:MFS transporter [Pseudomonadota bacterium]
MKHPFRFIAIVCLAQIFAVTGMMYFPALLTDFQAEWSLSNTEAGWINGIYYGGYAVTVPFLVSLTDRVDPRRVYIAASLLGAVSMFGFGLFAEGTWSAGFFRLLSGISLAGNLARFHHERASAPFNFASVYVEHLCRFCHSSFRF